MYISSNTHIRSYIPRLCSCVSIYIPEVTCMQVQYKHWPISYTPICTHTHTYTYTEAINGYRLENIILMLPRQTKPGKTGYP